MLPESAFEQYSNGQWDDARNSFVTWVLCDIFTKEKFSDFLLIIVVCLVVNYNTLTMD